ncbi:MAG: hypothetical protein IPQ03_09265 [Bacteroidetes bacterium]|nr:hypothetical protein [Bacteroidota bacterium]
MVKPGDAIVNPEVTEPSYIDGSASNNIIGRVEEGILNNENDFSIVKIDDSIKIDHSVFHMGVSPVKFKYVTHYDDNKTIVKLFGKVSNYRYGKILCSYTESEIDYGNNRKVIMKGLIKVEKISQPGDSGAVVLDMADNGILGLLISSTVSK